MDYFNILSPFNEIPGDIVDCTFTSFKDRKNYIDLAKEGKLVKRNYYIARDYTTYPWQQAHDYSNSIKNELKKSSRLYKTDLNLEILSQIEKISFCFLNLDYNSIDILHSAFLKLNNSGALIISSKTSTDEVVESLSKVFSRKLLLKADNLVLVCKNGLVTTLKNPARTKSSLT